MNNRIFAIYILSKGTAIFKYKDPKFRQLGLDNDEEFLAYLDVMKNYSERAFGDRLYSQKYGNLKIVYETLDEIDLVALTGKEMDESDLKKALKEIGRKFLKEFGEILENFDFVDIGHLAFFSSEIKEILDEIVFRKLEPEFEIKTHMFDPRNKEIKSLIIDPNIVSIVEISVKICAKEEMRNIIIRDIYDHNNFELLELEAGRIRDGNVSLDGVVLQAGDKLEFKLVIRPKQSNIIENVFKPRLQYTRPNGEKYEYTPDRCFGFCEDIKVVINEKKGTPFPRLFVLKISCSEEINKVKLDQIEIFSKNNGGSEGEFFFLESNKNFLKVDKDICNIDDIKFQPSLSVDEGNKEIFIILTLRDEDIEKRIKCTFKYPIYIRPF